MQYKIIDEMNVRELLARWWDQNNTLTEELERPLVFRPSDLHLEPWVKIPDIIKAVKKFRF